MIGKIKGTNDLQHALSILSHACDGASSRDSSGFNKLDAQVGHRMAQIPQHTWSEQDKKDMLRMLRKYKKQLMNLGFDYDTELVDYFYLESPNYNKSQGVTPMKVVRR